MLGEILFVRFLHETCKKCSKIGQDHEFKILARSCKISDHARFLSGHARFRQDS